MITTTEFFLFFSWALTMAYALHERHEARKAKAFLMLILKDDHVRAEVVANYKLFEKSIIKTV
jgi:hypothetical protein